MPHDLERLLRDTAVAPFAPADVDALIARGRRRRRLRHAAATSLTATAAVVAALLVVGPLTPPRSPVIEQPPPPVSPTDAAPTPSAAVAVATPWEQLPAVPLDGAMFPAVAWTGSEVLVWGGQTTSGNPTDDAGAAYDPVSGTWRELPMSPLASRSEHVGVWTGTEYFICCGRVAGEGAGAGAYDPATDTWQALPPSPLADVAAPVAVWTGQHVLVTGGLRGSEDNFTTVAFDPGTAKWRRLADAPVAFGQDASAVRVNGRIMVTTGGAVWAYDPEADTWSRVPGSPVGIGDTDLAWTGTELLSVRSTRQSSLVADAYNPETNRWTELDVPLPLADGAAGNLGSQAIVWTGDELLVWAGSLGTGLTDDGSVVLAYDPAADAWRRLPTAPGFRHDPTLIWTGDQLVVASGRGNLAFDVADDAGAETHAASESPVASESTVDAANDVTAADRQLVDAFVAFSDEPGADAAAALPFADNGVQLGLADQLFVERSASELADPAAWAIERGGFRASSGPFSALELIADHQRGTDRADSPGWRNGGLQISIGDHPHCASPPVEPPPAVAGLRRVSIQPAEGSIDTCLLWFTVDLFVNQDGEIEAVTLDLWEP